MTGEERGAGDRVTLDGTLAPLVESLDQLAKAIESGGLAAYDNAQLTGFVHAYERTRRRMIFLENRIRHEIQAREMSGSSRTGGGSAGGPGAATPTAPARSRRSRRRSDR